MSPEEKDRYTKAAIKLAIRYAKEKYGEKYHLDNPEVNETIKDFCEGFLAGFTLIF